jgi:hypothetical protein
VLTAATRSPSARLLFAAGVAMIALVLASGSLLALTVRSRTPTGTA